MYIHVICIYVPRARARARARTHTHNKNINHVTGFYGFDGLDWDIEGHDDKASPYNHFTPQCLELMGEMSVCVQNGSILSMYCSIVNTEHVP